MNPKPDMFKLYEDEAMDKVYCWIEQESSIMLKAVCGNDPVEMQAEEVRELAIALLEMADWLDAN